MIKLTKKDSIKLAIIGGLVLLTLIFSVRACRVGDRLTKMEGEYNALKAVHQTTVQDANKRIAEQTRQIAALDDHIAILNGQIERGEALIEASDSQLADLETELVDLRAREESVASLRTEVVNLESQLNIWKEKFTLAQGIIANKDGIIFSLSQKYDAQVVITDQYKKMYSDVQKLHDNLAAQLGITKRKLKSSKVISTIKTVGLGAVGGFLVYSLVKK